ncbi:cation transporter [Halodesulfovibrio sp.]|uniref:cation transporter n=1 Tax=Halodesulfovibrio sp. TaxID=1912772 RepID=UPI0025BFAEF4|nr:cation transporter [Halodesulfovibrio sp.]
MDMGKIEIKTMKVIFFAYLLMAIVGITNSLYSNSEAVLIDGTFNFISALSMIVGIKISKFVSLKPSKIQPIGFAMYETLYTLMKGIMMLGVILLAAVSNITKIHTFFTTGDAVPVNGSSILIYSISMVAICSVVYLYLAAQVKKTDGQSVMLRTEQIAVFQNGVISGAIGIVFLLVALLENTFVKPILPITDSIVVLILCGLLIGDPIQIVRNSFFELTIRDTHQSLRDTMFNLTKNIFPEGYKLEHIWINKLGRTYYFMFLVAPLKPSLPVAEMELIQETIEQTVKKETAFSFVDVIFSNKKVTE